MANSKIFDNSKIIYTIFFASGICGLAYEIVWVRMLGLILGNSIYAVSLVVAAFMAGLGLGSYLAGRYIEKNSDPLRVYAMLEIGIGIFAILSPFILGLLSPLYAWLGGIMTSSPILLNLIRFKLAFLVLLIPTLLMGGTLPVLSRFYVRQQSRLGGDIGALYGINTLGAMVGCLITGFVLIEMIGVRQTVFATALINLAIGIFVITAGKGQQLHDTPEIDTRKPKAKQTDKPLYSQSILTLVLIAFAISGFASIAYEVIWTRALAYFVGHTTYAFTSILASFLFGIGLGSLVISRFSDKSKHLLLILGLVEIAIGLFAILGIPLLGKAFYAMESTFGRRTWATPIWIKFLYSFCVMLFPTILMGMTFPLASKLYLNIKHLGSGLGRIYAVNTLGGILGSFAAVFLFIPLFGMQASIIAIAVVNVVIGAILIFRSPGISRNKRYSLIILAAALTIIFAIALPSRDQIYSITNRNYRGESVYYKEGLNNTIEIIERQDKTLDLFIDGELNASTSKSGMLVHRLLTQLPILLHPHPTSLFQVGLGSGMTSGAALAFDGLTNITCAEISTDIVEAATKFSRYNHDILQSPRFHLQLEDGRIALLTDKRKYDIMVTGIIHPKYNPGNAGLYSKDYYELCKSRLAPDGIMCQWIPLNALRDSEFKMIIATFRKVFPHTSLWFEELFGGDGNYNAILIGSDRSLSIDYARIDSLFQNPRVVSEFQEEGINGPDDLLNRFILADDNLTVFTGVQPEITDNNPRLEFGTVEIKDFSNILSTLGKDKSSVIKYIVNIPQSSVAMLQSNLDNLNNISKLCIAADAARWRGQASEVIAGYQQAARIDPDNLVIQAELAKLSQVVPAKTGQPKSDTQLQIRNLMMRHKFEEAIPLLEQLVAEKPDRPDFRGDLGLAYLRTGKLDMALEQLQKAVARNGADIGLRNNLGIAYMQKKIFDKAEIEFTTILQSDPNFTQALVNLGLIYGRTGRTEEAIAILDKALTLEPKNETITKLLDQLHGKK